MTAEQILKEIEHLENEKNKFIPNHSKVLKKYTSVIVNAKNHTDEEIREVALAKADAEKPLNELDGKIYRLKQKLKV